MRFLLPPCPGVEAARQQAPLLQAALQTSIPNIVVDVAPTYTALGDDVIAHRCLAAWVPPIVGARIEMAGGRILRRAIRRGQTAYRAGIVCRVGDTLDLGKASTMTAAWVDEDSAAGYLLARSWLAARHVDSITGFKRASFTHSYVACLQAVADGRADICSVFASVPGEPGARSTSTLDEVDERLAASLHIVAFTGDTRTDGVAVGARVDEASVTSLLEALTRLPTTPAGAEVFRRLLQCDGLQVEAVRPTSPALQALLAMG
jgi:phosphonate transport system substrate-binding protein